MSVKVTYDFLFIFCCNYAFTFTVFEILTHICQNCRRSHDLDTPLLRYSSMHSLVLSTNNLQTKFCGIEMLCGVCILCGEQSRIVGRNRDERSFHIFYQIHCAQSALKGIVLSSLYHSILFHPENRFTYNNNNDRLTAFDPGQPG